MTEPSTGNHSELLTLTSSIVSSYLSANTVPASDIPALIERIYKTLSNVNSPAGASSERPQPAVPIKKSITPDYIVCLEDGKKLKMLKRHLKSAYNLTPEEYRERWGLPSDYPMTAPNYADKRSKLAKIIGLGKSRKKGRKAR
ncbi:MAG: MucR family transcriptional regulator [Proteobacteria bacterium]|nr:MucR family transcriptional regulator [Pseudomonadota bacterium]